MKFYISGPITGTEDYLERFAKAENVFRLSDIEVVNPAEIMRTMPLSTTHKEFMDISRRLLMQCDAIYMLEGWHKSRGACEEFNIAMTNGLTIAFERGMLCRNPKEQEQ